MAPRWNRVAPRDGRPRHPAPRSPPSPPDRQRDASRRPVGDGGAWTFDDSRRSPAAARRAAGMDGRTPPVRLFHSWVRSARLSRSAPMDDRPARRGAWIRSILGAARRLRRAPARLAERPADPQVGRTGWIELAIPGGAQACEAGALSGIVNSQTGPKSSPILLSDVLWPSLRDHVVFRALSWADMAAAIRPARDALASNSPILARSEAPWVSRAI